MPILSVGTIISSSKDEYEVINPLGSGGYGDVYKVNSRSGQEFAAKIRKTEQEMKAAGRDDFDTCERTFEREIEIMEKDLKNCPYTPELAEAFDLTLGTETTKVIIMELIEGENLYEILLQRRSSIEETCLWTVEILKGLEWIHSKKIIWRDAKLENVIWVEQKKKIKLLDFGGAARQKPKSLRQTTRAPRTEVYMSPQVAAGKTPAEFRDDVFAMGAMMGELATGVEPLILENPDLDIPIPYNTPKMTPGWLKTKSKDPNMPNELERIIFRAKRYRREDRYQTATAMRQDVEKFLVNFSTQLSISVAPIQVQTPPQAISGRGVNKVTVSFDAVTNLGICPNCSAEIYIKDKFCHICGARIKK